MYTGVNRQYQADGAEWRERHTTRRTPTSLAPYRHKNCCTARKRALPSCITYLCATGSFGWRQNSGRGGETVIGGWCAATPNYLLAVAPQRVEPTAHGALRGQGIAGKLGRNGKE